MPDDDSNSESEASTTEQESKTRAQLYVNKSGSARPPRTFPRHFYSGCSFFVCPFPGCDDSNSPTLLKNVDITLEHLRVNHKLVVEDPDAILPALEDYLSYYARSGVGERPTSGNEHFLSSELPAKDRTDDFRIPGVTDDEKVNDPAVISMVASMVASLGIDVTDGLGSMLSLARSTENELSPPSARSGSIYVNNGSMPSPVLFDAPTITLGPKSPRVPSDALVRADLSRRAALSALARWERERREEWRRKCIFCKEIVEGRSEWWGHLSTLHSFYLGPPDNLISSSELVDVLSALVASGECPRCRRQFRDKGALRRHMRKRKHGGVDARDREWDRSVALA
ncbi:hypothetical protein HDU93_009851 [Gonapodya sp. JEL0774]|nr:hypothetical protein HDU93_009851 [Gonapodya sp. JEL0774]